MGGCLGSLRPSRDLTGSTFSHYSLDSGSDQLDLYPGFRYVETEGASLCGEAGGPERGMGGGEERGLWRRSSVPLLTSWESLPGARQEEEEEVAAVPGGGGMWGRARVRLARLMGQQEAGQSGQQPQQQAVAEQIL